MDLEEKYSKENKEKAVEDIKTAVLIALTGPLSCDEVKEAVEQAINEADKFLRSQIRGSHHTLDFNIMGTESFRFRCDKPNIVELPCKAPEAEDSDEKGSVDWQQYIDAFKPAHHESKHLSKEDGELCPYPKSPEYKHRWKDLTAMERVLSHLEPIGKLKFSCWDHEEHKMIPIIRKITDEKDRRVEDKITYIVNDTNVEVWTPEEHITYGKSYIMDLMRQYAWEK
jgi:hypothetical protein